jgi:hypothetical protein
VASAGDREPCRWYAAERLGSSRTAALCDALARSGRPRAAGDDYTSGLQRARLLGVDSDVDSDGPHGASGCIAAVTWLFRTPRRAAAARSSACASAHSTRSRYHRSTRGRAGGAAAPRSCRPCCDAHLHCGSHVHFAARYHGWFRHDAVYPWRTMRVLTTRHRRSNPGNVYPAAEAIDRVSTDAPRGHRTGHVRPRPLPHLLRRISSGAG